MMNDVEDIARYTSTDDGEMKSMMVQKAEELFHLCDQDSKDYLTKEDMRHLASVLPLSIEQLNTVFDSLDDDGNGHLTLTEFTDGFGSFLGVSSGPERDDPYITESVYEDDRDQEENVRFEQMLQETGAEDVLPDMTTVKTVWSRLVKMEPDLLGNFEDFLSKISRDMKQSSSEFSSLQSALKSKTSAHDTEVQKLYEEMEQQIRQMKETTAYEERIKERSLREQMDKEVREKDAQLQELMNKHHELEQMLSELNINETETRQENDRLLKERQNLEDMLVTSQVELDESQLYINNIKLQKKEENRDRARSALKVTEGIVKERESLIKQLDMLRDMNKKLRDEQDIAEAAQTNLSCSCHTVCLSPDIFEPADFSVSRNDLQKQGSVLSNYLSCSTPRTLSHRSLNSSDADSFDDDLDAELHESAISPSSKQALYRVNHIALLEDDDDDIECDDALIEETLSDISQNVHDVSSSSLANHSAEIRLVEADKFDSPQLYVNAADKGKASLGRRRQVKGDVNHAPVDSLTSSDAESLQSNRKARRTRRKNAAPSSVNDGSQSDMLKETDNEILVQPSVTPTLRCEPLGATSYNSREALSSSTVSKVIVPKMQTPQRLFKVVFVGDSGVGKSSFIHRFCNDHFKASFSATIGVDFQVKAVTVDGDVIALQLWDTAGQERFRSITKQYFRKADGVLVMYDIMCEASFKNIRNWMSSVTEGVEDGTALVVIGNKLDLVDDKTRRKVTMNEGMNLAMTYNSSFWEASAKSGMNVTESMESLARLLKAKEDKRMEEAITLDSNTTKKKKVPTATLR